MTPSREIVMWTALPNGIEDGVIRLSVFVSPRLINPGADKQELSTYPDFVNWIETLKRISFKITFEGVREFEIPPRKDYEDYQDRRRRNLPRCVVPKPLEGIDNPWVEVFGTSPRSVIIPLVDTFHDPKSSTRAIVSYSTQAVQRVLENQLGPLLPPSQPLSLSALKQTAIRDQFPTLTDNDKRKVDDLFAEIRKRTEALRQEQELALQGSIATTTSSACPIRLEPNQKLSSLFSPAKGSVFTAAEWNVGLVLFSREALKNRSSKVSLIADGELEFHKKVASISNFPYILRHLGLILDFELPIVRLPNSGRVIVSPSWTATGKDVEKADNTPWTKFEAQGNQFQAAPCGSHLFQGLLDLSASHDGEPCYSLEQRDGFTDAINLYNYAMSVAANNDSALPAYPAHSIALIHACSADAFQERIVTADFYNHVLSLSRSTDITLTADDLFRGRRMDIKVGPEWYSLSGRVGAYTFVQQREVTVFQDEGWIATTVPKATFAATELLVTHDIVCKWDGWSHSTARPGSGIQSSDTPKSAAATSTLNAAFSSPARSLPRLRFGQVYKVRVRAADLAGNGVGLNTPVDEDRVAKSITFLRYSPVPPPDFIPRAKPDTVHGESELTLVIRSNFDQRCEETDERHLAPPRTSESMAEMHGKFDKIKSNSTRLDDDAFKLIVNYDGQAPEFYEDKNYEPPYLPDPLSVGAHFHDLPGAGDQPFLPISFQRKKKQWPKVKPWRIRIEEHPNEPVPSSEGSLKFFPPLLEQDEGHGLLTIYLPKAEVVRITVSSALLEEDLEKLMGYWDLIRTSYQVNKDIFKTHILNGCHWMFTPCVQVTLVHAVQQPLFPPRFDESKPCCIMVEKDPGATSALLKATMMMPGRSANKFSLEGKWKERAVNFPLECGETTTQAQAFEQTLANKDELLSIAGRHEFNDTKHRVVTYKMVATTRFQQYLKLPAGAPLTRESREVTVSIPNSAVPSPPDVLYIIPTFGWNRRPVAQEENPFKRHLVLRRAGGGLRIYLKPPWYLTGENELLGVVLAPPAGTKPSPSVSCLSQWGRDPLDSSTGPPQLSQDDFDAKYYQRIETIDSQECAGKINVVGYPVNCDKDRKLWYADIVMIPGRTYYPFVRLALVRYQPDSLPEMKISSVKAADFVQLAPDRTASVVIDSSYPNQVIRLRLEGPAQNPKHRVEALVERGIGEPLISGSSTEINDIAWEPVSSTPYQMTFGSDSSGDYWEADKVIVPLEKYPHRILIKEIETLDSDGQGGKPETIDRIVYATTIAL